MLALEKAPLSRGREKRECRHAPLGEVETFCLVEPGLGAIVRRHPTLAPVTEAEDQQAVVGRHNLLQLATSYDPTRPITSWRTAWRKLTRKAGLAGLRFHDLRHHAITELAESGASEQTIMAIAGHVSRRMLERYSHIRLEAKRNALEALSQKNKEGYGTNGGTKTDNVVSVPPFFPQKMVGACGFEPQTPTVSR